MLGSNQRHHYQGGPQMNAAIAYFMTMFTTVTDRFEDKAKGATAVEYGLMVALIAVVIIGAVTVLGTSLSTLFTTVQGHITSVTK